MLCRPERTYPLIMNHAELIGEKTRNWPQARLKAAFADQPGAVLVGVMQPWRVNQVLAVAEVNAEGERILDWLREREVERLLRLAASGEPTSAEQARHLLNVDRYASPAMIRKVWRTLLGMLNADLGRTNEQAIHRKKDEIAKLLNIARDVMLKKAQ
jgi:hypothetical protein